MSRVATFCVLSFLFTACGTETDGPEAQDAATPSSESQAPSEIAFQLPERDLFPEGMTRDPLTGDFFVGSLRKSKILRITPEGSVDTLANRETLGQGGILGMTVDEGRRILWANFHQSMDQLEADPTGPFLTGIHKIDLETGGLIRSYSVEKEEDNHLFNDVALAQDGTAYITSFSKGTLYRIPASTGELEEWLPMPEGVFTNGIAMGPNGAYLFVAGDADIYRVEIATREVTRLEVPEGEAVYYGDGLYFHEDALLIIASWREDEVLHYRVARLGLTEMLDAIEDVQLLDQDHPLYAYPTTGVIAHGWFYYIASAQFDKVSAEGSVASWEELSDIFILRVPLPDR
jgi:sugar lactone lactonase YvrE